jgi:hypothetical protein
METVVHFGQLILAVELYLLIFAPPFVLAWAIHVARSLRRTAKSRELLAACALYGATAVRGDASAADPSNLRRVHLSAFGR